MAIASVQKIASMENQSMSTKENALLLRLCRSWSTTTWALKLLFIHMNWSLMGKQDLSVPTGCNTTWSRNTWKSWQKTKPWWLNRVTLLASSNRNQKLLVSSLPTVSWSVSMTICATGKSLKRWALPTTVRWRLVAGCTLVLKGSFTVPSTLSLMLDVLNSVCLMMAT